MSIIEVEGVVNLNNKSLVGWVLAVAALNWGLVGVMDFNVVEAVLGEGTTLTQVAYGVIGLVGVYKIYMLTVGKKK